MSDVTSTQYDVDSDSSLDSAVDTVRQTARQATGQAKGFLRQQIDRQTTSAGDQLGKTAESLHGMADQFRQRGQDSAASVATTAAERLDGIGDYLKNIDAEELMRNVSDYARRQPWVVAAGGFVIGFAVARFLKSSGERGSEGS